MEAVPSTSADSSPSSVVSLSSVPGVCPEEYQYFRKLSRVRVLKLWPYL